MSSLEEKEASCVKFAEIMGNNGITGDVLSLPGSESKEGIRSMASDNFDWSLILLSVSTSRLLQLLKSNVSLGACNIWKLKLLRIDLLRRRCSSYCSVRIPVVIGVGDSNTGAVEDGILEYDDNDRNGEDGVDDVSSKAVEIGGSFNDSCCCCR